MKNKLYLISLLLFLPFAVLAQQKEKDFDRKWEKFEKSYKASEYKFFNGVDSSVFIGNISFGHDGLQLLSGALKYEHSLLHSFVKENGYEQAVRLDSAQIDITDAEKQLEYLHRSVAKSDFFIFRTSTDYLSIVVCEFK